MPVLRQEVNTGSGALQIGGTNYQVGVAAPQVQQEQPKVDSRGMAIQGFLSNFLDTFTPALQEGQQRAAAQGQIDASQNPDALKGADSAADKQNIFMRDAYQKGYLGAAVRQTVTDFQSGITSRAQAAGMQGVSDDDFLATERQQNAKLMNSLGQYMPHMDANTVSAVASSLDNGRNSALGILRKTRLGQAKVNNMRVVEQGSMAAMSNFTASLDAGATFEQAQHYLTDHAALIGSNEMLDEKEKRNQLGNLFVSTAQNLKDPRQINQLAGVASGILGVTDPSVMTQLDSQWKRAGSEVNLSTELNLTDRLNAASKLPGQQRQAEYNNILTAAMQAHRDGYLTEGAAKSLYTSINKPPTPKALIASAIENSTVNSNGALSVEAIRAGIPDATQSQVQDAIGNAFPNTLEGNVKMLAAGQAGKDPWIIKQAYSRIGTQMTDQLDTLANLMDESTDDQGNKVYTIPASVQQSIVGFSAMYQNADAIQRSTLMDSIPEKWRGLMQSTIEQDPDNVNNNVVDTLKRVTLEERSGMYKDVKAAPPKDALDTTAALRWYQRINPVSTDSEDSQRAQFGAQLQAEYDRVYQTDKSLLSGKSAKSINQMLVGNIQARTVPVTTGRFASNVVLPAGTSLDSYGAAVGVDGSTYQEALQATISSTMDSLGIKGDNMKNVRITPGAGGALSKDFAMTVEVENQAGQLISQHIALPASAINAAARDGYVAKQEAARAIGRKQAGPSVATFMNTSHGGQQTMTVTGSNNAGMAPDAFNRMLTNTMRYEGFKGSKSNGSVGFGWHAASGDAVPSSMSVQEGVAKLKDLYEQRYVPMAKGYLKDAGLDASEALPWLADLAYERPADAKAVASAMGQYTRHEIQYPELIKTLEKLPSYTDAGGSAKTQRNIDRYEALQHWAMLSGSRGTDPSQNPVAALYPK